MMGFVWDAWRYFRRLFPRLGVAEIALLCGATGLILGWLVSAIAMMHLVASVAR